MNVYLLQLGEYSDRYVMSVHLTLEGAKKAGAREVGLKQSEVIWKTDRDGIWTGEKRGAPNWGGGFEIEKHHVES
jgi:hypothetical protein